MGLNISVLTPLGGPPSALPVAAVAGIAVAPSPTKVAPSGGSGHSGLEAGLQQGKPRQGADLQGKNRNDTSGAEPIPLDPQSNAQMGETLRVSIAPKGADAPRPDRAAAERESKDQPDYAKALAERVMLLPEKGDLSLEASRLPPYGERAGEEPEAPTALRRV